MKLIDSDSEESSDESSSESEEETVKKRKRRHQHRRRKDDTSSEDASNEPTVKGKTKKKLMVKRSSATVNSIREANLSVEATEMRNMAADMMKAMKVMTDSLAAVNFGQRPRQMNQNYSQGYQQPPQQQQQLRLWYCR